MLPRLILSLTLLFAAAPTSALAQEAQPVEIAGFVMAEKVTTDEAGNSTVELVEPKVVVPGDRLILGVRFTNAGSDPVENFVVTNPLPEAVTYASDADPALEVSVDGGVTWGQLASLEVVDADGNRSAAGPDDVNKVRWTLTAIAPGESGQLAFPVFVR